MIKICFICTGNTCRSVMAERLMKKRLKEKKIDGIKVFSKGLNANGEGISQNAKVVLKKMKASSAERKSVKLKKIDKDMLYVTMTDKQKSLLNTKNVISFSSLIGREINDPYGQDEEVYFEVAQDILKGIDILIEKVNLWREV